MSEEKKTAKKPRSSGGQNLAIVCISLFLLSGIGLGWYLFTTHHSPATAADQEISRKSDQKSVVPPQTRAPKLDTSSAEGSSLPPPEALTESISPAPGPPALESQGPWSPGTTPALEQCQRITSHLADFLALLEQRDYIASFELDGAPRQHFLSLAQHLLTNPPVVSREVDDLYTILRNTAHFFHIIGKDNILLFKTILDREREKIEDIAADLYQWTILTDCTNEHFEFRPSLEQVYEYAGFFLNTLGGRSYLFRRDSRSRLLVNFYSVLLVEQANREGLNRHGIDLRETIPLLINEIEGSNQLIYKEHYLERLNAIMDGFPQAG
ncbi:MAG: hypothetical protein CSA34_02980 [Desulfobulbus propionicus]|nr:MAG: hypothetical protein CSA34_02980 [Desulfobulbus propionicus]